jgi:DNA end-binding protein Ku
MAAKKSSAPTPSRGSKLTIGFGIVNVDVKFAPLVAANAGRTSARTCCREHMAPVSSEYRCDTGGELVAREGKVMAYETPAGFVEVDTDALGLEGDKRLDLTGSVDVDSIDPLYFEKAYVVWPQEGHEASYDLLAHVLHDTGKALVGTTVMAKATKAVVLRFSNATGTLVAHGCTYDERLSWNDVTLVRDGVASRPDPDEKLVAMAETLLTSLDVESFDFEAVKDEYGQELDEAIERTAAGMEPIAKPKAAPQPEVTDLAAALAASVADAKAKAAPKPKAKAKREKVAA